ncbi:MAG TPA: hypothetical protein GX497_15555 [Bacillus bacterium]|nr:hypothetical protein [Bacillus sp. (in: firmicutes)]
MIQFNSLQTLFQSENLNTAKMLNLKAGDIVNGQIVKLFPDNLALVQIGAMKLNAKVTTPLTENTRYWFQVAASAPVLELKLVDDIQSVTKENGKGQAPISYFLEKAGLPETKENAQLVRMFLNENLPFSKEALKAVSEWLTEINKGDLPKAFEAIKLAVQKQLPLTEAVLKSLLALQTEETISHQLLKVIDAIKTNSQESQTMKLLQMTLSQLTSQTVENKIDNLMSNSPVNWNNGKDVVKVLKQLINHLGLQHEHNIMTMEDEQSIENRLLALKPLLMKALSESSDMKLNEKIQQLLSRITGQQLINVGQEGPIQQLLLQLPIMLHSHSSDLLIQWTGKKRENGQIDSDHCTILFYIELVQLQEMLVDVRVQNRIVTIQIYNDTPQLDVIVKKYQMALKEQFANLRYHLSSIVVTKREEVLDKKINSIPTKIFSAFPPRTNGVDIRI